VRCCFAFHNLMRFDGELGLMDQTKDWFDDRDDRPQQNVQELYASDRIPDQVLPISLQNLPPSSIWNSLNSANRHAVLPLPHLAQPQQAHDVTPPVSPIAGLTENANTDEISSQRRISANQSVPTSTTTSNTSKQPSTTVESDSENEQQVQQVIITASGRKVNPPKRM